MNDDLVTVASFPDSIQAHLALQHLEASGIRAVISGENVADTHFFLGAALGGVKVLVAKEDALRAVAALEARLPEPDPPSDAITTPDEAVESHGKLDLPEEDEIEEEERIRAVGAYDEFTLETDRSLQVDRAFKATLLGLLFCPLFLYAWWLLLDVMTTEGPLSDRARKRLWILLAINATVGFLLAMLFFLRMVD